MVSSFPKLGAPFWGTLEQGLWHVEVYFEVPSFGKLPCLSLGVQRDSSVRSLWAFESVVSSCCR